MKIENNSARGITILNIIKEENSKAYRLAEKHCVKYFKVPGIIKSPDQKTELQYESKISMRTTVFDRLKSSN